MSKFDNFVPANIGLIWYHENVKLFNSSAAKVDNIFRIKLTSFIYSFIHSFIVTIFVEQRVGWVRVPNQGGQGAESRGSGCQIKGDQYEFFLSNENTKLRLD